MRQEAGSTNLTTSQLRIWTGQKLQPDLPLYNMALAFYIEGELNLEAFRSAFSLLLRKSDALRTRIHEEAGTPRISYPQVIDFSLELIDLSEEPHSDAVVEKLLAERTVSAFDLEKKLFDSVLCKLGEKSFVWYLNQHHLITDGWSCEVVYKRMTEYYQLALDGRLEDASTIQRYRDYQEHEAEYRNSPSYSAAVAFWREKQAPPLPPLELYGRFPSFQATRSERVFYDIGRERSTKLRSLLQEKGFRTFSKHLSLFQMFSALLFAYLYKISGNPALCIGTPSHNRPTALFKETIGLFIELFPFRVDISSGETFRGLITSTIAPESYAFLKNAQPGSSSVIARDAFSVVLNYINASFPDFCGMPMHSTWMHPGHVDNGHALRLQVHDFDESNSFHLHFDFSTEIFDTNQREKAVGHFMAIFDSFLENPGQSLDSINLLGTEEFHLLVEKYNDTDTTDLVDPTVLQLFKEQVIKTPGAIAVVDGNKTLSYRELDQISDQMALNLKQLGIGREDFVAVCMDRSASLIVSLLAILKAGAAFVPIDSAFPEQRLAHVLEDSGCVLVLTSGDLKSALPRTTTKIIEYDELTGKSFAELPATTGLEAIDKCSLAYMIYTSGSTGRPKGVMIEHRALLNYLAWARKEYMADGLHDLPLFSSVAADLTLTSLFLPLISGSSIVVYPEGKDGLDLSVLEVYKDDRVDIIKLTPSHLALLDGSEALPVRVKKLIVGGEDFKASLACRVSSLYGGNITIYNEYGPTEATIGCMIYRFSPESDSQSSVAIGNPIDNLRIYLLDKALNPVPAGVKGDLYIGGAGLARGYHKQEEMTAEKFIDDPFLPGEKIYYSGDIGRLRSAGVLDYLGRDDDQVKVRGFRIEKGEIEAVLCNIDGISESFCQVVEINKPALEAPLAHCRTCGLPANVPKADLDENEICAPCRNFEKQRHLADQYFKTEDELHLILERATQTSRGRYNCLMQYSGGKDSTFALYKLVEMGMHPLVFSFDNGFIPKSVKDNVRRIVDDLGLDLHWGRTEAMNQIFVDSLNRFSNVCNGCQKVINTMSVSVASEHDIEYIFTGLSRGQSFETRVADLLNIGIEDINEIDTAILEARKAYHQMDDAVNKYLDVSAFDDESIFERIQFIDFYRYYDIPLAEVLDFLNTRTPWTRPPDTGRSTNCLINEAGIYIHKKERGYHNYAAPYSWDVRLGHKQRPSALKELEDDIDEGRVNRMLKEIGYDPDEKALSSADRRILAYYVGEKDFTPEELRASLGRTLPGYMIPAHFLRMNSFPLNATGKIDHRSLPLPGDNERPRSHEYVAPRSAEEELLTEIWEHVLGIDQIGIYDNFFDLGGDSILNIQIVSRAVKAGIHITPALLFQNQTIAELAVATGPEDNESAESDLDDGLLRLTPIQHWYFNLKLKNPNFWNMSLSLKLEEKVVPEVLERAFQLVIDNHPSLRMRFKKAAKGWEPSLVGNDDTFRLERHAIADEPESSAKKFIDQIIQTGHESLDIQNGPLLKALLFEKSRDDNSLLFIIIHHLVVDGISWYILLDDLQTVYQQLREDKSPGLLPEQTSFSQFSQKLFDYANSPQAEKESLYWKSLGSISEMRIPRDTDQEGNGLESSTDKVVIKLQVDETHTLLYRMPGNEHASVEEILLSCLVKALHNWSGNSFIRIDKEGHGREDAIEGVNLLRTTGWFTSLFPINFIVPAEKDIHRFVQAIKQQVRSIPNRGFSFAPLSYLSTNPQIIQDVNNIPQSDILFNHLGELRQLTDQPILFNANSPLKLHKSSDEKRSYLLELASFILNGQLEVHWSYSRDFHKVNTINSLAEDFLENLIELVDATKGTLANNNTYPEESNRTDEAILVAKPNVSDSYPLTPLQSGILFHTLKEPNSGVYIEQYCCTIEGDFNPELFQRAWNEVIDHHQILRASFIWEHSDEPLQLINDSVVLDWHHEDLRGQSNDEISRKLDDYLSRDRERGFYLEAGPLMRCALFVIAETTYRWIWSFHHILCDGWSTSLIINELFKCYDSLCCNQPISFLAQRSFRDYVFWLKKQDQYAAERFWRRYLRGLQGPTALSNSSFDVNRNGYNNQELKFSEELSRSLIEVSKAKRLTLNTVIQGAWSILLHRYSGDNDIIFGTTVSGRPHELEGVDTMVGLFINTLPFRIKINSEKPFAEWLADILVNQIEARDFDYSSLVKIHEWSDFPPGVPLFDSILVFENYPTQPENSSTNKKYTFKNIEYLEQSNFPLSILVIPGNQLKLLVYYNRKYFTEKSISRLLGHLKHLVHQFIDNPNQHLGSLSVLTPIEADLLLRWQGNNSTPLEKRTVQQLFEEKADHFGAKIAVCCGVAKISYQELNQRANCLANYLIHRGVVKGNFVGIYLDRSVDMVVAILAVLKSGAAYVPLDPDYPKSRINHMLGDARPASVLTLERKVPVLSNAEIPIICLDAEQLGIDKHGNENPDLHLEPDDLAYVIYTSGSTGVPKGVMINHRNLYNSINERIKYYNDAPDRFLLLSSISFDSSVAGIFGTLCRGGTLFIPEQQRYRDVGYLAELIHSSRISQILAIPSLYKYLLQFHPEKITSLSTIIVAGETCGQDLVEAHQSQFPKAKLFNEYGPTEATVWSTVHKYNDACPPTTDLPIGRPIGNMTTLVLDNSLRQVPPGVAGELYLSGASISPGYLNQPDHTADRFIDLKLPGIGTQRAYKTGDLARFLDDGELQFLGRNDEQVKMRGYRIELGEIESALKTLPAIQQAAIVPIRDLNRSPQQTASSESRNQSPINNLVAFITLEHDEELDTTILKPSLAKFLPMYMIPSDFILLDSLPLNPNGKIDRTRLPDPGSFTDQSRDQGAPPETGLERDIAAIWGEVLGVDKIFMSDNFFDLGGHSLMAVKLFARIKNKTGIDLPLATLFDSPTLHDLATQIELEITNRSKPKIDTPIRFKKAIVSDNKKVPLKTPTTANRWDVIVPIRAEGSLPPLFLLHAVFGNILNYTAVLPFLDQRQPVYALQAVGLDGISVPYRNLDQMMTRYVQEIKKVQPDGPYLFAGLSFGGLLALELAQLLIENGDRVDFVGMFDTVIPPPIAARLKVNTANPFPRQVTSPAADGAMKPTINKNRSRLTQSGIFRKFSIHLPNNRAASIFSHMVNLSCCAFYHLLGKAKPHELRGWFLLFSHTRAIRSYKPKTYDANATLFRSTISNLHLKEDYGWREVLKKDLEIIRVPEIHSNAFMESPTFGAALTERIQQSLSNQPLV